MNNTFDTRSIKNFNNPVTCNSNATGNSDTDASKRTQTSDKHAIGNKSCENGARGEEASLGRTSELKSGGSPKKCTNASVQHGNCEDMCFLKKLKILNSPKKTNLKREVGKNKRIKKASKARRREARRRRRAKRRVNKMRSIQFSEEVLNNIKQSVLNVLYDSSEDRKSANGQSKTKKELRGKNITGGIIRGIKGSLLGKRSDSVKSIETTDGEAEGDGFSGKGGSGGSGGSCWSGGLGCCCWQPNCTPVKLGKLNNLGMYDICPVKRKYLSQDAGAGLLPMFDAKHPGEFREDERRVTERTESIRRPFSGIRRCDDRVQQKIFRGKEGAIYQKNEKQCFVCI